MNFAFLELMVLTFLRIFVYSFFIKINLCFIFHDDLFPCEKICLTYMKLHRGNTFFYHRKKIH